MNQTHVRGGRDTSGAIQTFLAATGVAGRVLAGAAIVEALAVASFGLVAGTAIAVLAATAMGITYFAVAPG